MTIVETLSTAPKPVLVAAWTIIIGAVLALLALGSTILIPLVIAVIIWLLINALAKGFGRLHLPGWLSLTAAIGTIIVVLLLVGEIIASNIGQVSAAAPTYEKNLTNLVVTLSTQFGVEPAPDLAKVVSEGNFETALLAVAGAFSDFLSHGGLVFIYVAFLLVEQKTFPIKLGALYPNAKSHAHAQHVLSEIGKRIQSYIWMKTLTSLIVGVATYIVVALVGLEFAALWALLGFLANFIPVVGGIVSLAFPVIMAVVQFGDLTPALIVLVGCGIAHFINGNIIEPALIGRSMNLSPMVIMLALAVWGLIWGIPGMVLSTPITVSLMTLLAAFEATRPAAVMLSEDGHVPWMRPSEDEGDEATLDMPPPTAIAEAAD